MEVAQIWPESGEQGCWSQCRNDLTIVSHLSGVSYEGGEKMKGSLVWKASGTQRSHVTSLKLWIPRVSVSPFQAKKPETKSQLTPDPKVHHVIVTKLVTLPHFPSINFLDPWEIEWAESQDTYQMEKQTSHYPLLTGPCSKPLLLWMLPNGSSLLPVGSGYEGWCQHRVLGLLVADHCLSTWQPSTTRIQSGKQKSILHCLPCITSIHNCILMDMANTTLYVCHGPSDLSDPWVKGTIIHLYVQLPMTGLHDKAQRHFDEVNNLAPSIITCHSQIRMPFQGLLHQSSGIMSPLLMTPGQCKLYAEAKLHRTAYEFKEEYGWRALTSARFWKHKLITQVHFHFKIMNIICWAPTMCHMLCLDLPYIVSFNPQNSLPSKVAVSTSIILRVWNQDGFLNVILIASNKAENHLQILLEHGRMWKNKWLCGRVGCELQLVWLHSYSFYWTSLLLSPWGSLV